MSFFIKLQRIVAVCVLLIVSFGTSFSFASGSDLPPEIDGSKTLDDFGPNELLFTGCSPINFEPLNTAFEQRIVELTNDHRASVGRPPLKRVTELDYASRYHARDMMEDNYFNHDTYDRQGGALVKICDWNVRIERFYANRTWLGENIAAGYSSPESAMQGWLNSSGHRENMESGNYWEIGVGYYPGGSYRHYWVQDFGRRTNIFPVVINREYAQTDSPDVTLYIYGQGVWDEMRLRNDSGNWTDWQPFQANVSWRLNWIRGVRSVTVEMRRFGQPTGAVSSDTIELTTGPSELTVLPGEVVFLYNQVKSQLLPAAVTISPTNLNNDFPLNWQLSRSHPWIMVSPTIGSTPTSQAEITIDPAMFGAVGSYDASITITVTEPADVTGSPKVVPVRLIVVEDMPFAVFLPSVRR